MKKSTFIIICIVYIASIALINFFGMKIAVYSKLIDVESVQCINQTDDKMTVEEISGVKTIKVKFTTPFDINNNQGTGVQLICKVLPDNATNKTLDYIYTENPSRYEFYKNPDTDMRTGFVMIYKAPAIINVKIISTDGTQKSEDICIVAYLG